MDVDLGDVVRLLQVRDVSYADDLLLAAVVRLDLMTLLAEESGTLDELCRRNNIASRPADVLCTLLRAMRLLEPGDVLRPTPLARACLVRGSPYDVRPYLAAAASRPTCLELAELLRTGRPSTPCAARRRDPALGEHLAGGGARARVLASFLVDVIADLPVRSVLDVTGSSGCGKLLAERRPGVSLAESEWGDLFARLPSGHDLHVLSHLLHCRSEAQVRGIVQRCYDALLPGGWLVDHDTHLNADKTGPLSVARYSALLLHATEGKCWSVAEMAGFLSDAGFVNVLERPCGPDRTAILAQKPS